MKKPFLLLLTTFIFFSCVNHLPEHPFGEKSLLHGQVKSMKTEQWTYRDSAGVWVDPTLTLTIETRYDEKGYLLSQHYYDNQKETRLFSTYTFSDGKPVGFRMTDQEGQLVRCVQFDIGPHYQTFITLDSTGAPTERIETRTTKKSRYETAYDANDRVQYSKEQHYHKGILQHETAEDDDLVTHRTYTYLPDQEDRLTTTTHKRSGTVHSYRTMISYSDYDAQNNWTKSIKDAFPIDVPEQPIRRVELRTIEYR